MPFWVRIFRWALDETSDSHVPKAILPRLSTVYLDVGSATRARAGSRYDSSVVRLFLLIASLLLSLVFLELGLTATYVGIGNFGPLEIVPEWDSPFVFRVKPGRGANAESIPTALRVPPTLAPAAPGITVPTQSQTPRMAPNRSDR